MCDKYDVLLVYNQDERCVWTDVVLHKLRATDLTWCSVEDIVPGESFATGFVKLLKSSRKVLFILSNVSVNNGFVALYSVMALQRNLGNIVTLTIDRNVPEELQTTKIIFKDSESWWDDLIKEIKIVIPKYCQCLDTRKVSDLLTLRGLCMANINNEIFGIFIAPHQKFLKVNLEEFIKHEQFHKTYDLPEIFSTCEWIKHTDTFVSLVMKTGFLAKVDRNRLKNDIVKFCVAFMIMPFPIETQSSYTSLTSCLSGPYDAEQQKFISDVFMGARYSLFEANTRKQIDPCFPEFETSDQRRNSFPVQYLEEEDFVEKLAEAGFFYYSRFENTVRCYHCDVCLQIRALQGNKLDPIHVHREIRPSCRFIKSKANLDKGDASQSTNLDVQTYNTFSARKNTFDLINIDNNEFGIENFDEREKLAKSLAGAGFYYFGYNSVIGCFSCGLSVEFSPSKDPWAIHAILSSECEFLVQQKGIEFVQSIHNVREPGMSEITIVTFSWRKFGSDKNINTFELKFRPHSNDVKYRKIKMCTGRIKQLNV